MSTDRGTIDRDWLTERVAHYLEHPADSLDPDVDLAAYGMDSLYALNVISDIEDRWQLELDATLLREHPTLNALAGHLDTLIRPEHAGSGPGHAGGPRPGGEPT